MDVTEVKAWANLHCHCTVRGGLQLASVSVSLRECPLSTAQSCQCLTCLWSVVSPCLSTRGSKRSRHEPSLFFWGRGAEVRSTGKGFVNATAQSPNARKPIWGFLCLFQGKYGQERGAPRPTSHFPRAVAGGKAQPSFHSLSPGLQRGETGSLPPFNELSTCASTV